MPYWIVTFSSGIGLLLSCPKLPSLYWILILIPILSVWFLFQDFKVGAGFSLRVIKTQDKACGYRACSHPYFCSILVRIQLFQKFFFHFLILSLGFFWALIYVNWVMSWSLPTTIEGKTITVVGYVASLPTQRARSVGFVLTTDTVAEKSVHTKLKLSWYGDCPEINVGDKWQLTVRLKKPHGTLNPGGFDKEKYLLLQHIRATGYVVNSQSNRFLSASYYRYFVSKFRYSLINKIEQALTGSGLAPIIIALITGAEDKITQSQ